MSPVIYSWISAATYYTKWKGKGYVASINCNLLIIKWEKSELDYVPTPGQGKELVLSICREHGLPEPYITSTPDGIEVKFYWRDRMQKVFWVLVCAQQAGLIMTYEEFCENEQKLINFCGVQFASECTIETVKTAFTKDYYVKTGTLIHKLQITPEAQKVMKVLCEGKRVTTRKRSVQTREEYRETHDQERRKPWLAYDFSRRTYFRRKAARTLPPLPVQPVQTEANVLSLPEKKSGTSLHYIMTRARVALLISLCQSVLARFSARKSRKSRGYQGVQQLFIPLLLPKFRKWVRFKLLVYCKRRRKSKRKRKRKRG